MHRKLLPTMISLQCFECAARHLSFTRAAQELSLTQSAISKQVSHLESLLQRRLFNRIGKGLELTPAGELYLSEVNDILTQTDISSRYILSFGGETEVLRIATQPTFGSRWLIPALPEFSRNYPHIRLNVRNELEPFDLVRAKADIAFYYGRGSLPGARCIKLFGEDVVPVCSPDALKGQASITLEALAASLLLQCTSRPEAWHEWFKSQSVTTSNSYHGPQFDTFDLCIRAAMVGMGFALIPRFMVEEEIARGTLVIPWNFQTSSPGAYYMAHAEHSYDLPKVRSFTDWARTLTPQPSETE